MAPKNKNENVCMEDRERDFGSVNKEHSDLFLTWHTQSLNEGVQAMIGNMWHRYCTEG